MSEERRTSDVMLREVEGRLGVYGKYIIAFLLVLAGFKGVDVFNDPIGAVGRSVAELSVKLNKIDEIEGHIKELTKATESIAQQAAQIADVSKRLDVIEAKIFKYQRVK